MGEEPDGSPPVTVCPSAVVLLRHEGTVVRVVVLFWRVGEYLQGAPAFGCRLLRVHVWRVLVCTCVLGVSELRLLCFGSGCARMGYTYGGVHG